MNETSSTSESPHWGVTMWRSGSGESDWRYWSMVYTNQGIDSFLKKSSAQYVGRHAGDPVLSEGFDENHLTLIFENVLATNESQEAVLRFNLPERGIEELFLLYYLIPLDQNHCASLITPIEVHYVPENFDQYSWSPIKGPQHYGLGPALVKDFEKQMQRVKAMLAHW